MEQPKNTFDMVHFYISKAPNEVKEDLLEKWSNKVIENGEYGFENGFLGLGWLICYLIQEGYIEGDADEILEDIDDTLYKLTIKEVLEPTINTVSLLYYVTYYQQRLQYKSKTHFYRGFTHFECMKLLLERLNKYLLDNNGRLSHQTIKEQVNIVLKYSYLVNTCLNEELVEEAFYITVEKLIDFFEHQHELTGYGEDIAKLYVCVRQYENPHWENRIKYIYSKETETSDIRLLSFWEKVCLHHVACKSSLFDDYRVNTETADHDIFEYFTNINTSFSTVHDKKLSPSLRGNEAIW